MTFKAAAIIGHPAAHSRSPLIHGHWLERHGLSGAYLRCDVAPDDLPAFLADLTAHGLVGANVTIPHKEAAFRLASQVDEVGRALRAVNTLWLEDGKLNAANTDVHGFLANLDAAAPRWDWGRRSALVIGAGGASRAAVYGLMRRGFNRIVVLNRTVDRAEQLRFDFGRAIIPGALDEAIRHIHDADLIVNTTSVGLEGEGMVEIDFARARPQALVTDLVYVPLETPFLAAAKAHGLPTVDGLGMLLHQAVPGFTRWFGVMPTVTPELRALVIADLEDAHA